MSPVHDKENSEQVEELHVRTKQQALQQMDEITSQPTETAKTAKWEEYSMKENLNPSFKLTVHLFR